MTLSVRVKHLFLLPLLLLMASCSRYSEAEIKGVCSRYWIAVKNSKSTFSLVATENKRLKKSIKVLDELEDGFLKSGAPSRDSKTFKDAESLVRRNKEDLNYWRDLHYEEVKKEYDLYATILKIQGRKDVEYYRQFVNNGDKQPRDYEDRYEFYKKNLKDLNKGIELFSYEYSTATIFCNSYGVKRPSSMRLIGTSDTPTVFP